MIMHNKYARTSIYIMWLSMNRELSKTKDQSELAIRWDVDLQVGAHVPWVQLSLPEPQKAQCFTVILWFYMILCRLG